MQLRQRPVMTAVKMSIKTVACNYAQDKTGDRPMAVAALAGRRIPAWNLRIVTDGLRALQVKCAWSAV